MGRADFRSEGQSSCGARPSADDRGDQGERVMAECHRRPELGVFDPTSITFEECPEWKVTDTGYLLEGMRVMILGIDGYLGWTLALRLGSLGCEVSGIDNQSRRRWVAERGSHSVVPIESIENRLQAAREVLGIEIDYRELDLLDRAAMQDFIQEVRPEVIVQYAECPSAPYSMLDAEHAVDVQRNNVLGTLGLLFMMRDVVPESSLVKLGTMGEYGTPLSGRPIFEGVFPPEAALHWDDREWSLGGELIPRDPSSFYHVSKVQDTINVFEACKWWKLRSYDVMQGVIFGVHTDQVAADPRLRTRFDIDECFGTVINRFVAQAVAGIPLTIYGTGGQTRGFIALEDAMQCMTRLISSPPEPGQYEVVNQLSGTFDIRELAEVVDRIGKAEFGLPVVVERVENPRVEASSHPFEPIYERLPQQFGFESTISLEEEVHRMFALLTQPHIRDRVLEKSDLILPTTWWSGDQRPGETIEVL